MAPRRTVRLASLPVMVLFLALGCSSVPGPATTLPPAERLVSRSLASLRSLESVEFRLTVTGTIPGFPVRSASGVVRPTGRAQGTIELQQGTAHTVYRFTLRSGVVRLHAPTERVSSHPLPDRYAPARLLAATSGLGDLLDEATHLRTETAEKLHGTATFRIAAELDRETLAGLIPGVWADAIVKFWIGQREPHWLQRLWIQLPSRRPNAGVVTIQLRLSRHNAVGSTSTP